MLSVLREHRGRMHAHCSFLYFPLDSKLTKLECRSGCFGLRSPDPAFWWERAHCEQHAGNLPVLVVARSPNFFLLTKPHPPILLATPRLLQCRIHWNILSPKIKSMKTFTISVITTIIIRSLFSTGPCSKMYFWPRMWIFSFIYIGVYLFEVFVWVFYIYQQLGGIIINRVEERGRWWSLNSTTQKETANSSIFQSFPEGIIFSCHHRHTNRIGSGKTRQLYNCVKLS